VGRCDHGCVGALEFVSQLVSSLIWPAVVVTFGLVFRKRLNAVLHTLSNRLTAISGGGFEAQFDDVKDALEIDAALTADPTFGRTIRITGGEGERSDADPGFEINTALEAEVESPHVQLDAKARDLFTTARAIVPREPRQGVLLAGRALELSVASTLDTLGIPYGVDAKGPNTYVPAIFALRQSKVVDDTLAEMLSQLYELYRSAARDRSEEVTGMSALQYISLVEQALSGLAATRRN
jgi:hypothetical protein